MSATARPATAALYVHFPWCIRKCPYCDFNSHPLNAELPEAQYIDTLLADWAHQSNRLEDRKISSVFFGGGTPSLFQPASFDRLIHGFAEHLLPDAEITMEANPGSLEYGNFADYRQAGINRLSMGVQSFDDTALQQLGRIHSAAEARGAIDAARQGGFDNVNVDLMHGLPDQTTNGALNDLTLAIESNITHISWYQLTLEPRTEFAKRPPVLPDEDTLGSIETEGLALLRDSGFERYEVSAYARNGKRSQHNLNYWDFGDYLGLGAGAHGKLTNHSARSGLSVTRTAHARQPRLYLAQLNEQQWRLEQTRVERDELPSEFMMNALRLLDGVSEDRFEETTGIPFGTIEPKVTKWRKLGLMHTNRLALTALGLNALDTVVADFLAD